MGEIRFGGQAAIEAGFGAAAVCDHLADIGDPPEAFTPARASDQLGRVTTRRGIDLGAPSRS